MQSMRTDTKRLMVQEFAKIQYLLIDVRNHTRSLKIHLDRKSWVSARRMAQDLQVATTSLESSLEKMKHWREQEEGSQVLLLQGELRLVAANAGGVA